MGIREGVVSNSRKIFPYDKKGSLLGSKALKEVVSPGPYIALGVVVPRALSSFTTS